jgi:hypothetical protein
MRFLNSYVVFNSRFSTPVFPEKRLELKSLKERTKAEELEDPVPDLLSFRLPRKAL